MHKIKRKLASIGINVGSDFKALLIRNLIAANAKYKKQSGNNWNCLTSNNLIEALENVEKDSRKVIQVALNAPGQSQQHAMLGLVKIFEKKLTKSIQTINQWFDDNYNDLLYDMNGNIPWPIIQQLHNNLAVWISTNSNPFTQSISEMIVEVANDQGIDTDDAFYAWEAMGGKIFSE